MVQGEEEASQRLERLEAAHAIAALKARYWRAIDGRSPDDVAACLTDDVEVDFEGLPPYSGRSDFMAMIREAALQPGQHLHLGRNPIITVTGPDSATGVWDIHYQGLFPATGQIIQMAGGYDDAYRREDGAWRIAAMTMRQRSFVARTLDPDKRPVLAALPGETPRA